MSTSPGGPGAGGGPGTGGGRRQRPARDLAGSPDLLGPLVCNVAGALMVVVAWVATSGQADFRQQLPYVNLGVGGVILAGAGDVVFLLGYRRLIRRRIARVTSALLPARQEPRR